MYVPKNKTLASKPAREPNRLDSHLGRHDAKARTRVCL